jgi:hypothetical protein
VAITEEERFELFERAKEVFGDQTAGTLMTLLPPGGWADVATKHDLDGLAASMRADMSVLGAALRSELHELRAELYREQRQQLITFLTANAVLVSVIVTVVQLLTG